MEALWGVGIAIVILGLIILSNIIASMLLDKVRTNPFGNISYYEDLSQDDIPTSEEF